MQEEESKKNDMRAQKVEKNQRQRKKHEPNKNKEKHIKFGMDLRIYGAQNLWIDKKKAMERRDEQKIARAHASKSEIQRERRKKPKRSNAYAATA